MLNKKNRLTEKFEFNVTKKHGDHHKAKYFHMYSIISNKYEGPAKVGFVVSNHFERGAVKRNKIKRRLRKAFFDHVQYIPDNYWVVIYPRQYIKDANYKEIESEVNKTIQKVFVA